MTQTKKPKCLLVANRGEIAVRILRAAAEAGLRTVAVYSDDDARSLHVAKADQAAALGAAGPRAYLDAARIVQIAHDNGCDALHPGYGFLAEDAGLARLCESAGIVFVGPSPETLELFGDKSKARALAGHCGVPVLAGSDGAATLEDAHAFFASLAQDADDEHPAKSPAMMIKALAGGGGRGMRAVTSAAQIDEAFERCRSEAAAAFGNGDLYVERLLPCARHIEVQIVGDGTGAVSHLGERECSLQRRNQKIVEIAPSPTLSKRMRESLTSAAVRLAEEVCYRGLGTFEFLVGTGRDADTDSDCDGEDAAFAFIEANPRLQVEHTVTEAVTGLDLVAIQLRIAGGAWLADLGLSQGEVPAPRGFAMQARVNMEVIGTDASVRPSGGTLSVFEPPAGPGVRVDSFGYAGYTTSPAFDSLLAKVITHSCSHDFAEVVAKTYRALCEFRIEGVATNINFLQNLLRHSDVVANRVSTSFVETRIGELLADDATPHRRLFFEGAGAAPPAASAAPPANASGLAGARIDSSDPLAVLRHGRADVPAANTTSAAAPAPGNDAAHATVRGGATMAAARDLDGPTGAVAVAAPLQGTIVSVAVAEGETVRRGTQLLVMEAMKMEHVISANVSGTVRRLGVLAGDTVFEGHPLVFVEVGEVADAGSEQKVEIDLARIRPDLAESIERHAFGLDAQRPDAVARRRKTGQRTARENIDDLCDEGSFAEYGALTIAAQRRRRDLDDLIRRTPGDGMICGVARVNGALFPDDRAQCVVMSYDYTVLAGTQGMLNHRKKDRMFEIAREQRLPVVILTEGGGGRPGDIDAPGVAGLDCLAFQYFGKLSGLVPLVGINSGYCFAGNAALLGCCDVIIATANSSIGMGGPAMIEGGGLGVFRPGEVGPMPVQIADGVVDLAVENEAEAIATAKRYLAYFQGPLTDWNCADQRMLRAAIPENRLRIYDVRSVIETLADTGSVLELRRGFGAGMVTALVRIEGRTLGIIANNPSHLAGAIDPDGADKAARFMQLCDSFDLPLLFLCDTPGIMVGPEVETRAMVRHAARMFVVGASLTVPFFTIILRKGYGLGAQAMAGGSFHAPLFTVAWPTGEFGGMGLEGAVKLGFQKELAAVEDPAARKQLFDTMVAHAYEIGKAVNMASHFEIDDVIDPMESRRWITTALNSAPKPPPPPRAGKKRPCVDAW